MTETTVHEEVATLRAEVASLKEAVNLRTVDVAHLAREVVDLKQTRRISMRRKLYGTLGEWLLRKARQHG
jgi:hypothetical protein